LLVLSVDYPLMDCVCKNNQGLDEKTIIKSLCMSEMFPRDLLSLHNVKYGYDG
jgi:hypothetical protein